MTWEEINAAIKEKVASATEGLAFNTLTGRRNALFVGGKVADTAVNTSW